MWGVTTYFNPAGYGNKLDNLHRCADGVRVQGLKLLIVEAALGGMPFQVSDGAADLVVRVRARSVLWHKERLINIGLGALPPECDQVAWLDGDLLFENVAWVHETERLLDEFRIVQPFSHAIRLPRGEIRRSNEMETTYVSTAYAQAHHHRNLTDLAGHPGFVWAARRELVADGLYDRCILGGGDMAIAFAVYRMVDSPHLLGWLDTFSSPAHRADLLGWIPQFNLAVDGRVYYGDGTVSHLWHGESNDRQYATRPRILIDHNFDPRTDIALEVGGCWEWASQKVELHRLVKEYFSDRREDG